MKSVQIIVAISTLLFITGCKPGPATIVGSVSFLNPAGQYHTFPPTGHSGNLSDDVAYIRLLDNDGLGVTIWESSAIPAGSIITPFNGIATSDEGEYIDSFVITLSDSQIAGLTMPLRLEAYLYDAAVAVPALDPATDIGMYSYYDSSWEGNPGWYYSFSIQAHEIRTSSLFITLPY